MKKLPKVGLLVRGLALGLTALSCANWAEAHPYASGVTTSSGSVSFYLNELPTSVQIIYGNNQATNTLASPVVGVNTFSLTYNSVAYTKFAISVYNVGNGKITEISSDTNTLNSLGSSLNSVAVNTTSADKNFGRIYMGKRLGGGFYVRNPDQSDALGQGTTALIPTGMATYLNAGGSSFDTSRMYVGPDEQVYVGAATTVANGFWLASMDPNLATYQFVLTGTTTYSSGAPTPPENHGGVLGTPVVTGTIAGGNLVVTAMDWAYPPGQNLLQWNIGAGPLPSTVTPTALADSTEGQIQNWADGFVSGNNYYTYLDRSSHTSPGFGGSLSVFNAGSSVAVWQSFNNSITSGNDYFANCADVIPDPTHSFLVGIDNGTGDLILCNLDANGIPVESTLQTNVVGTATSGSYGSIAFDAAQNIYQAWNGNGLLKVFSPGLTTLAVTGNDSTGTNGTFSLTFPNQAVSASATVPVGSQNHGSPTAAQITLTRSGITTAPLTINFTLGGTASNAVYTATSGSSTFASTNGAGTLVTNSITFPAGQSTVTITITPVSDSVPRLTTTAILTILASNGYSVTTGGGAATASIINTGPQAIEISGIGTLIDGVPTPSAYKGLTNDYASFVVSRLGDTNAGSYMVTNFTYSGTATAGVDYTYPARTPMSGLAGTFTLTLGGGIQINPGDVSVIATISPLQSSTNYVGNKTAIIGVGPDSTYALASTNTATLTIVDNAYPPATVLFADSLTNSVDGNNNDGTFKWNVTFANTNKPVVPDYDVEFGYPVANDNVGNPPNGSPYALKVTVNKGGNGASAGVNLYPTNINLTGNFAVRFDMMLIEGDSLPNAVEYVIFGIDHSGLATNWFASDDTSTAGFTYPSGIDGVWYGMDAEFSGTSIGDFAEFTGEGLKSTYGYIPLAVSTAGSGTPGAQNTGGKSGLAFASSFKNSYDYPPGPYTAFPYEAYYVDGVPSSRVALSIATAWVNVEIKQINNVITMSMNKTAIFTYTNTALYTAGTGPFTISTNGTLMLGYVDPFASIGSSDAAAYFSNIQIVQEQSPAGTVTINGITVTGGVVTISFTTSSSSDTAASFSVLGSGTGGTASGVDTAVSGATITQVGTSTSFTATFPQPSASAAFYRIKHN